MYRFATRTLMLSFCLLALAGIAEENRIVRVGVAMMQNQASRNIPGDAGRNRLVAALNQQKPDKKQHLKLEGVPLTGTKPEELANEAKQKNCDYVVYTNLVELQASSDSTVQPRPNTTVQPYPGGTLGMPPNAGNTNPGGMGPGARGMSQSYRATVDYQLYRTGDQTAVSSASLSGQQPGPEDAVVSQVLNQIASRILAEVKKAPAAAQR